jgi:spermidine synthase
MAVIWRRQTKETLYEVRQAGQSRRLYTNGAFPTQYHRDRLLTNAVWALLTIPALFSPSSVKHALVLGVGGGTAIHQLAGIMHPASITGVEIDAVHLQIARKFFGISTRMNNSSVNLVQADAGIWVSRSRRRFDLIIDDIFDDARRHGQSGDPLRPIPNDQHWLNRLTARLSTSGTLVQNLLTPAQARQLVAQHRALLQKHFKSVVMFETSHYSNAILGFYRNAVDLRKSRPQVVDQLTAFGRPPVFRCTTLFSARG